jgi:hypothetical protein
MVAVCAKKKLTLSDHEVKTQKNQAIVQKNPLAIQSHLAFSTKKMWEDERTHNIDTTVAALSYSR